MPQDSEVAPRCPPSRPVLRYHGGKWRLAPWIMSHFPEHSIYVEPYGGAASVLLRKPRVKHEVLNDLNGEIVNVFRMLRERGDELACLLHLTPFSRLEYRGSFEPAADPLEQARRTIVRSFMGHGSNSLCRAIQSGFRSRSGRKSTGAPMDWRNYPAKLMWAVERLRGVVIESRPAIEVLRQHDSPATLCYLDPPYVHRTRSTKMHGHHGYDHEMTDDDHRLLAEAAKNAVGAIVLSGYHDRLYDELYASWNRVERETSADGGMPRVEVLWSNRPLTPRPPLRRQEVVPAVAPGAALHEVDAQQAIEFRDGGA